MPWLVILSGWLLAMSAPLMAHGDLHERIAKADAEVAAHPADPARLIQRVELLIEHEEWSRAEADLAKLKRLAPQNQERHLMAAKVAMGQKAWRTAQQSIDVYLKTNAESPDAWLLRSQVLEQLGKFDAAISDARAAISRQSSAPPAHHMQLIQLLQKHGTREEAAAAYAEARKRLGRLPTLLASQARWLAEKGDRDAAAGVYGELRALTPKLAFSWWAEEAAMWKGHDDAKANIARERALQAWSELPATVRKRPAMTEIHLKLNNPR